MSDCAYDLVDCCNSWVELGEYYIVGQHYLICHECADKEENKEWVKKALEVKKVEYKKQIERLMVNCEDYNEDGVCPF